MTLSRKISFMITILGIQYGLVYSLAGYFNGSIPGGGPSLQVIEGLFLTLLMPFVLHLYRATIQAKIIAPLAKIGIDSNFSRYEPYSYLVFLLSAVFLAGISPSLPFTIALGVLLILVQVCMFILLLDQKKRIALVSTEKYVPLLFLVSGFSALIYQIVWQRALFTTFGVNSESVTVIVSVFMFGLGIGSLVGGYLQAKYPRHLLHIFLLLEILIGLFGLVSLDLIHAIGRISDATSPLSLLIYSYGILALPTLLMGATLPVLVAFLQVYIRNIGKTVGVLYAFNTIGSAIAAFCTVEVLFVFFGQQTTVLIAAACNFITAYLIFDASKKLVRTSDGISPAPVTIQDGGMNAPNLPYPFVFIILLAIGYISLSQEILWFKLLGYMTANRPQVFGLLLTAFLIGIAKGSLRSERSCTSNADLHAYLVRALVYAAALFYIAIPLIAYATSFLGKEISVLLAYLLIAVVAFFTGGILPMLIHLGIKNKQSSSTLSVAWLYFANIIGATLGPLLTGFILLNQFTLEMNVVILTVLTLLLLLSLLIAIPKPNAAKLGGLLVLMATGYGTWLVHPYLFQHSLEKIQYATPHPKPFKHIVENRSGIISVEASSTDIMYGGGIYDGQFNTSILHNSNMIDRAYMIAALHRTPHKVLEIGLSTGSWTKVITDYAPLEKLTVIEINKGYPEVIRHYPDIANVLEHPKVTLHYDDGRRWLRNHPGEKFDFIVMNTTFHWRSNASNLLSRDFLELCKQHLNPNGVVYYNTTFSKDVTYTAAHVFKHVVEYANFVAASDAPFDMSPAEKKQNLLKFQGVNKAALFDSDELYRRKLDQLATHELKDIRQDLLNRKDLWLITDDNMAVEYKNPRY